MVKGSALQTELNYVLESYITQLGEQVYQDMKVLLLGTNKDEELLRK